MAKVKVKVAEGPMTLSFQYGVNAYVVEFDERGEAEVEDHVADILRRRYRQKVTVPAAQAAIKTEVTTNALSTSVSAADGASQGNNVPNRGGADPEH